jgi:hypothetical protein
MAPSVARPGYCAHVFCNCDDCKKGVCTLSGHLKPAGGVSYAQDEGRAKLPPPCDVDDPKEGP